MTPKLSVATPVVTMDSNSHVPREEDASIGELTRIADGADRHTFHHLTGSEHIALPAAGFARRSSRHLAHCRAGSG